MPEEQPEVTTVTEIQVTNIGAGIEEIDMYKDHGKFIETDTLIIHKTSKDDGTYVAHIKISAILEIPENPFERAELFQQVAKRADKNLFILKKALKKRARELKLKS